MTTFPDLDLAKQVAQTIVSNKLAACVNIMPKMTSIYRWQGKLEMGEERLLIIKTEAGCIKELQKTILKMHPYELPEMIVVPITGGHAPYLDWIGESVS